MIIQVDTMNKLPQITLAFWIMKICATTLGETAGDLLSMTLDVGYAISSLILISLFVATLVTQLAAKRYHPMLYWLVILSTSTAGTTMSDFMDRTLGLGYATGSAILITLLMAIFCAWYVSEKSLSVDRVSTLKGELFYWFAILISNTLGTALGDYLADDSGLGFAGGAVLIGSAIALVVVLHFTTRLSSIMLFWIAFVLTRPFGATLGDVLTKPYEKGGLDFGTVGSSAVLLAVLLVLVVVATYRERKPSPADNRLIESGPGQA
ncbi:putative Membrane protein [Pseudomonas savastanoi pv. glycinea]|uniref:Membrane protein n=3 Tax=Pseudomonas savastanoi TaxID=29438 RepID=A0A3M3IA61_PSESG|nr:putative Membrane protein [Pseudomonas syringae pv. cunninghamiae]KPY15712.1 putative Membrane protein [Pseudomonas savastanoi pv. phaseolicola]RMM63404.1 putative Membrane protein [Pseudomonas savastanoi pv. glycinea]RMV13670.1 putative Membrane protein [Pseudomonas savastanoi]RMM72692.1 putative Membrane protein [Pseudomonas savastanoi pv. glycinea]